MSSKFLKGYNLPIVAWVSNDDGSFERPIDGVLERVASRIFPSFEASFLGRAYVDFGPAVSGFRDNCNGNVEGSG